MLSEGKYRVEISYPSYKTVTRNVTLNQPLNLEIYLQQPETELEKIYPTIILLLIPITIITLILFLTKKFFII